MRLLTFKEAFGDCFGCDTEDFSKEALKKCLYPHARILWGALELGGGPPVLAAHVFMDLIAETRGKEDLLDAIKEYRDEVRPSSGVLARRLKLRVSVERLLALHHFVREVEQKRRMEQSYMRTGVVA